MSAADSLSEPDALRSLRARLRDEYLAGSAAGPYADLIEMAQCAAVDSDAVAARSGDIDAGFGPDSITDSEIQSLCAASSTATERSAVSRLLAVVSAHQRGLPVRDGAGSLKGWLRDRLGLSSREAARLARQVRFCLRHPEAGDALAAGRLSMAKLELLIAAVAADLHDSFDDSPLLAQADLLDADDFAELIRIWRLHLDQEREPPDPTSHNQLRMWSGFDGYGHLDATLDAEAFELLIAALELQDRPDPEDRLGGKRPRSQRLVEELVKMAKAWLGLTRIPDSGDEAPESGPVPSSTINVLIDLEALFGDADPDEFTGPLTSDQLERLRCDLERFGPIGRSTAERLCCGAYLCRLLTKGRSVVLDMGFRTRFFTEAQQRAIIVEFPRCPCGCDTPAAWCDLHHIVAYDPAGERGPTDTANGVPLCRPAHGRLHRGELVITKVGPGEIEFRRPD